MSGLALRSERRTLSQALGSIGELKNVNAHSVFEQRGFTDVINTQGEVAGNRSGCRMSILYLFIGNRDFWRVVGGIHDNGFPAPEAAINEVADAIDHLSFL